MFNNFGIRNIRLYYLASIFTSGWFIVPNWLFYMLNYVSLADVGIIEGVGILYAIALEVPTGAIADLFGKKRTLILAHSLIAIGALGYVLFPVFWGFLISNLIFFTGITLHSGSFEALSYDSLVDHKQEKKYDDLLSNVIFIRLATTIFSYITSGILYAIDSRLPFIAWLAFTLCAITIFFLMQEPKIDTYTFNLKNYIKQQKQGFLHLFNPKLFSFILPLILLSVILSLNFGVIRQQTAAYFGLTGETYSYVLAIGTSFAAIAIKYFKPLKQKLGEKLTFMFIIALSLISAAIVILTNNIIFGLIFTVFIVTATNFNDLLVSSALNKRIESKYRATTISSLAFIRQLPYVTMVLFAIGLTSLDNLPWLYAGIISLGLITTILFIRSTIIDEPNN